MSVRVAYATHVGTVKQRNEDALLVGPHVVQRTRLHPTVIESGDCATLAVSDGLGRMPFGENASRAILTDLAGDEASNGAAEVVSPLSVRALQQKLVARFADEPGHGGCGATLALAQIHEQVLHVLNVGNSRVYRVSRTRIERLSREHDDVRRLADTGELTLQAALRAANFSGKKAKALVADANQHDIAVHQTRCTLADDDWVLVCSDGLTNVLDDEDIFDLRQSSVTVLDWVGALLDRALECGGHDNISLAGVQRM